MTRSTRTSSSGGRSGSPAPTLAVVLTLAALAAGPPSVSAQEAGGEYVRATEGTRRLVSPRPGGARLKILLEPANLGSDEVAVAEIVFPSGGEPPAAGHRHGSTEIFYILSGTLDHVVNGESHRLEPGMVGVVRAGDEVIHRVRSADPVRALVIWVPGTEVERIAPAFEERPLEEGGRGRP